MNEIRFTKTAEKYFRKIKEKGLKTQFRHALGEIVDNPFIGQLKTGDLAGVYCYDVHYNKINYEIAYGIYEDDDQVIVVMFAGTRENFYNALKRYMK